VKTAEIRDMTDPEIAQRIDDTREELFRLRFRGATQPLENPSLLRSLRREVAQLKTILGERQRARQRNG
jgi:large subunit ribosomal protein L29